MPISLFGRLLGTRRGRRAAAEFFATIAGQARNPVFYQQLGVPDSLDGRFDMVALHVFLVMRRLKGQGAEAARWSQALYEVMVADFEAGVMELGVGDSGISRKVKTMARGMAGRIQAYDAALQEAGDATLEVALDNNVYGTVLETDPQALATLVRYVRAADRLLAGQPLEDLLGGRVRWPDPLAA
ncbi:ubiquinol-cytochrome C chaperone family protein [Azospirillum thermophilum]|uniref:ubiquinol-cytochrome C chaperone family protein n=1 Tax=Azospirillum thermophilum TaxID=2202148 RepID=UPI001FE6BCDB|nr:ubiquinol-cytochrome C chaperone family protein [Azospirillum thermophilum]